MKNKQKPYLLSKLITDAAEKRGVKVNPILPKLLLYELKKGDKSYTFFQSLFGPMESASFIAADRKDLSFQILKQWGIPIPESKIVYNFDDCKQFLERYKKIVVKPKNLKWGLGITAGVTDTKILKKAIDNVTQYVSSKGDFVVQEFVEGDDYRLLVIGYEKVFCLQRNPAYIIGDGKLIINELIKKKKIKTGSLKKFLETPTKKVELALKMHGFKRSDIPARGKKVRLSTTANVHFGGFTVDKTDEVCEEAKKIAIKIAKRFASPVLGIDFISEDISKTPGGVIEINPTPDVLMHTQPTFGKSYNPAEALIGFLFFSGKEKDLKRKADLS